MGILGIPLRSIMRYSQFRGLIIAMSIAWIGSVFAVRLIDIKISNVWLQLLAVAVAPALLFASVVYTETDVRSAENTFWSNYRYKNDMKYVAGYSRALPDSDERRKLSNLIGKIRGEQRLHELFAEAWASRRALYTATKRSFPRLVVTDAVDPEADYSAILGWTEATLVVMTAVTEEVARTEGGRKVALSAEFSLAVDDDERWRRMIVGREEVATAAT